MSHRQGCIGCPHCVNHGVILLRSCSIARDPVEESNILVECEARPELGLFEPFREDYTCPLTSGEGVRVPIS